MRRTDVLVAGGGPVGLCLALLLVEAGRTVTVVEAEASPGRDLRASTFHPPTLDMLDGLGVTPALIASGLPCPRWQVRLHPGGTAQCSTSLHWRRTPGTRTGCNASNRSCWTPSGNGSRAGPSCCPGHG